MVCNTFNNAEEQQVAHSISSDEGAIAVSDGSYHPDYHHGTAAWIICNRQQTAQVFGNNLTPGSKIAQCSHRSELSGLIGVVKHINDICSRYNITSGNVEVGCDGEEAFKIATRHHYRPTSKISHHDLTSKLHHLINSSPIS